MRVQDLSLFKVPQGFRGASAVKVQLWWIVQGSFFALSPQFMYGWRVALLRFFGAKIGNGVKIRPGTKITYPWKLEIGDHCWIGDGSELYNLANITIGSHVALAQNVHVTTGSHRFRETTFDIYAEPIVIEDESWLCAGCFIHQGVTIGIGSVIGACAVVQASTPPYSINAGFPSRTVGRRIDK